MTLQKIGNSASGLILVLLVIATTIAFTQNTAPASAPAEQELTPSKQEQLELENLQLRAILAQQQAAAAQRASQEAFESYMTRSKQVIIDNKWDATTKFDPNTRKFSKPAPPEKK